MTRPPSAEPLATENDVPETRFSGLFFRFTARLKGVLRLLMSIRGNESAEAQETATPSKPTGGTEPVDAEGVTESEERPSRAPFFLSVGQVMLVVVVALILGVIGGLWNGYSRFAATIDKQSLEITDKQAQLKKLEKEVTTAKSEVATQQTHLAEIQKKLDDSQHDLAQAVTTAQTQKEELERIQTQARPQSQSQSTQAQAPQLQTQLQIVSGVSNDGNRRGRDKNAPPVGGQCDINAGNPAGGLAQCIEMFNRLDRRGSK